MSTSGDATRLPASVRAGEIPASDCQLALRAAPRIIAPPPLLFSHLRDHQVLAAPPRGRVEPSGAVSNGGTRISHPCTREIPSSHATQGYKSADFNSWAF